MPDRTNGDYRAYENNRILEVQDGVPPAQSQYFGDFLVQYSRNTDGFTEASSDRRFQIINNIYAVMYVPLAEVPRPLEVNSYSYNAIPKCYTYMDVEAVNSAGIFRLHNHPFLNLRGQGTVIAIIDSGIDYRSPIFRQGDSSRIVGIWDQTLQGEQVEEDYIGGAGGEFPVPYGREFTKEEIDRALAAENPLEIVPSVDTNGHGTMLAGIAAGNTLLEEGFSGAAPEASLLVVKLKPAKEYLKEFYLLPPEAEAFQENDIMLAIRYAMSRAQKMKMPLSICLGLGTSQGSHTGSSPLSQFLTNISGYAQNAVCTAAGNEGSSRHHYQGTVLGEMGQDIAELRVGPGEMGFTMEFWGDAPENYQVSIQSPSGETIPISTARGAGTQKLSFVFVGTRIEAAYVRTENGSGRTLIFMRFFQPSEGIWRFLVYGRGEGSIEYHLWLPVQGFVSGETYFLRPSPYHTVTSPGDSMDVMTVTAYDYRDQSLYLEASRGYSLAGQVKPDFAAPGVEVLAPLLNGNFGTVTGTSVAAALTAGAAAMMFQWSILEENALYLNGRTMGKYFSKGAKRQENYRYPNPEWGYGQLDLYHTFELLS